MSGGGGKQTIGYKYYLGMHMVLCHGPIDHISGIYVDNRLAWPNETNEETLTEGGRITVNAEELFGGAKREGGVSGDVDVEMGASNQTVNSYLVSQLGIDIPAFRGVVGAVLNQCYLGNNPYIKAWSFRAQRIHKKTDGSEQWYDAKAAIAEVIIENNFQTQIEALGLTYTEAYAKVLGSLEWPFATSTGDAGRYFVYDYYISAPTLLTTFSSGGPSANGNVIGYPWTWSFDSSNTLSIACDSAIYECLNVKPTGNQLVIKPNPATAGAGNFMDGDYAFSTVITGWNGTGYIDASLVQNPGKVWTIYRAPSPAISGQYAATNVQISSASDGMGGYTQTLSISIGGSSVASLPLGAIGHGWSHFAITVQSDDPENVGFVGPYYEMHLNVRVVVEIKTPTQELTVIGEGYGIVQSGVPFTGFASQNTTFYTSPSFFRNSQVSIAALAGGVFDYTLESQDEVAENLATLYALGCAAADAACGQMNPAHIIRECLTDSIWGMGYQDSDIDDTSFMAAADALYLELMGISLLWDRSVPLEDFIAEILRHIDGVLYVSRKTGKFVLKLIRDDYSLTALTILDETNVSQVSNARRPTIGELTNSITARYYDEDAENEQASVSIKDQALIQIQGAVIGTIIEYPGFSTQGIAARVAQRDLRGLSIPLLTCEITANREAADLNIGDPFLFSWPDIEVESTVMRVEGISFGDGRDNSIKISAVEDVFGLANHSVISDPTTLWTDPSSDLPSVPSPVIYTEMPYYYLVQRLGETAVDNILTDDPGAGSLLIAAGRQNNEINAELYVDFGLGYINAATIDFVPYADCIGFVDYTDTTIRIENGKDLTLVETSTVAQIEDELVRIDSIAQDSNGYYVTLGRGVLDSVPAQHAVDSNGNSAKIIFWGFSPETDGAQTTAGEMFNIKLLPTRGANTLSIDDAVLGQVTFSSRAIRPYPPGNLKISGDSYPSSDSNGYPIGYDTILSWAHRDRTQQTSGTLYDYTYGDIGPEAGTSYTVYIDLIADDGSEYADWHSASVGSSTSYQLDSNVPVFPSDVNSIRFRVRTSRGGYDSWQDASIVLVIGGDSNALI